MKKILYLFLIMLSIVILTGCSVNKLDLQDNIEVNSKMSNVENLTFNKKTHKLEFSYGKAYGKGSDVEVYPLLISKYTNDENKEVIKYSYYLGRNDSIHIEFFKEENIYKVYITFGY